MVPLSPECHVFEGAQAIFIEGNYINHLSHVMAAIGTPIT